MAVEHILYLLKILYLPKTNFLAIPLFTQLYILGHLGLVYSML